MDNIIEYDFSRFTILFFIFLSILLFVFLRLLKIILPRILKKRLINFDVLRHYSAFELLTWLVFLFWSLPYLYRKNIYYAVGLSLIVLIIIIWIGWYALRDIISGFIIRNNPAIRIDNKIVINQEIITIFKLDATQVEGRLENGNIIYIKYNILLSIDLQQIVEHELTYNKTIELTIAKTENQEVITNTINSFLLTQPNYAIKHLPEIKKISQSDNNLNLIITIYALNAENIIDIEEALRKKFES